MAICSSNQATGRVASGSPTFQPPLFWFNIFQLFFYPRHNKTWVRSSRARASLWGGPWKQPSDGHRSLTPIFSQSLALAWGSRPAAACPWARVCSSQRENCLTGQIGCLVNLSWRGSKQ